MAKGSDIIKYADAAMYDAQPMLQEEGARVTPRVFLLNATQDPLGSLAADMRMYRGDPVYSLDEITDDQREWAWEEVMKTHLNTPLEGIDVKFMIEAVTRSFTHQMVRQRVGAYYVQESLRFAVKKGIAKESALPPSIITELQAHEQRGQMHAGPGVEASDVWHDTIVAIEAAYAKLIALGIPAEDARGLLPHCVTTRLIYKTNLRALFEHASMRLCTQAQFEWRAVFLGIVQALAAHKSEYRKNESDRSKNDQGRRWYPADWQWKLIAEPRVRSFTPICYRQGTCAFMSQLDRGCTIRDRVLEFAKYGIKAEQWHVGANITTAPIVVPDTGGETLQGGAWIPPISPEEWMSDPYAGITTETNRPE